MKLSQILGKDKITLSFEVFPPKTEANYEAVKKAALDVAALNPPYTGIYERSRNRKCTCTSGRPAKGF